MDLVNISISTAASVAIQGYIVVFTGLILLMAVITVLGRIMIAKEKRVQTEQTVTTEPVVEENKKAPGSAGELKLYDTDPRAAAMCMAIVANKLGKPLNELRFISIREVKQDEI